MAQNKHLDVTGKLARLGADSGNGVAVEVFKALGNESRWRILRYLGERFVTVNQIASPAPLAPAPWRACSISALSRASALLQAFPMR